MNETDSAPWFDQDFYRATYGSRIVSPLRHFLQMGEGLGHNPSPYFSTRYYKSLYPDWAENGAGIAFEDFMARLEAQDVRVPHPLFDLQWYKERYPDLPDHWPDVYLHFQRHGDAEMRQPSAGFQPEFYASTYLDLGTTQPFRHYVTQGQAAGLHPAPPQRGRRDSVAHFQSLIGDVDLVIGAHNAQRAGVPIMALDMARAAHAQGRKPLFLLERAGPLLEEFKRLGPVSIIAEGWDLQALSGLLPPQTPVIINSAECADMAADLADSGFPTLLLIHEMRAHLEARDLLPSLKSAQEKGAELVVSFPRLAADLAPDLGQLTAVRPGLSIPHTPLRDFKALRQRLRGQGPVFISAGQGSQRKGFDLFLDAARSLQRLHPSACFIWLGTLDPWAQKLATQARSDGLQVILPGFVTNYPVWYHCANIYLLTSRQDPGPATALHAVRMGVPFVAYDSDIGMASQVDDRIGHFVPDGDAEGYVQMVQDVLARDTHQHRRRRRHYARTEGSFAPYFANLLRLVSTQDAP